MQAGSQRQSSLGGQKNYDGVPVVVPDKIKILVYSLMVIVKIRRKI